MGEAVHKDTTYPGEHQAIVVRPFWDRAHDILRKSPRARARNTRPRTPALLRGLIFGGSKVLRTKLRCGTELFTLRKWSGHEKENETS